MRWTLANRISVSVVGVVLLALFSSAAALFSTWHVGSLLEQTINENLPSVRAAEELEIAVLEQRGFVSSYLLDNGNPKWLQKLEQREDNFGFWLSEAHKTAHTAEEEKILAALRDVYDQYDSTRNRVVELFDEGDTTQATKLLVEDVALHYDRAYGLCERFLKANESYVDKAATDARRQIRWVSFAVGISVLLTIGLAAFLLWLFFRGVVLPLRVLASDTRGLYEAGSEGREPLPVDELRTVGVYLRNLMTDVADAQTTLQRSRRELKNAEKLASVGKLAASVAHEIRTPLTAIKMWLFSIEKEVGGSESLNRKFRIVSEEMRRLENIVHNFLEFSRTPELNVVADSISPVLDAVLELVEPRLANRRIQLVREDAQELPSVLADQEQLRQVLLNLLNNAMEATDEGGQIKVTTNQETLAHGKRMVVVRVSDTGPGIPDETARRIFEPFFSTKEDGTGLGLCIAARIMARHDGRLVLESSSAQGTTFAVQIPLAPANDV